MHYVEYSIHIALCDIRKEGEEMASLGEIGDENDKIVKHKPQYLHKSLDYTDIRALIHCRLLCRIFNKLGDENLCGV